MYLVRFTSFSKVCKLILNYRNLLLLFYSLKFTTRFGEACHFVELWKNSPANSFIFTDAEFYYLDALAPYQPVYANYYYFPIDTSLSTQHINKLLKEPKHIGQVIASRSYCSSTSSEESRIDVTKLSPNTRVTTYAQNDIIKLELRRKYENCDIDADLATIIVPTATRKTAATTTPVFYQTFNAQLVTKNNHHTLKAAPKTIPLTRRDRINEASLKKYPYGKLNLDRLMNLLKQSGLVSIRLIEKQTEISNIHKDQIFKAVYLKLYLLLDENLELDETGMNLLNANKYLIEIDANNRIDIDINSNKIDVVCDNEDYRLKIKDSLLKCFKAF